MTRHNISISIPDEELRKRILAAVAKAGAERGKPMSVSEWIREVVSEKLG